MGTTSGKIYPYATACVRGEGGGHFMIFFWGGGGNDPLPHTNMGAFCSHNLSHFQQKSQFKDFLQTFNTFCGGSPITPAPPPYKYWCILLTCFSLFTTKITVSKTFCKHSLFLGARNPMTPSPLQIWVHFFNLYFPFQNKNHSVKTYLQT